tara:strand:+ start:13902 stop:15167 length:1266 start_codon:yes stop_codon:yes gene_type:complete
MATPFFKGNYGSALARIDTTPIMQSGIQQGQMYANMGKQFGGMIKQYGLNKQKKEKATKEVEDELLLNPQYAIRMTTSGDEVANKKNQNILDRLAKGDLKLSELEGLAGTFARMGKQDDKDRDDALALLKSQLTQTQIAQGMAGIDSTLAGTKETEQGIALKEQQATARAAGLERLQSEALDAMRIPIVDRTSGQQKLVDDFSLIETGAVDPKDYTTPLGFAQQSELVAGQIKGQEQDIKKTGEEIAALQEKGKPGRFATYEDAQKFITDEASNGRIVTLEPKPNNTFGVGKVELPEEAIRSKRLTQFDAINHPNLYVNKSGELYNIEKGKTPTRVGVDSNSDARILEGMIERLQDKVSTYNYAEQTGTWEKQDGKHGWAWYTQDGKSQFMPASMEMYRLNQEIERLEGILASKIDITTVP